MTGRRPPSTATAWWRSTARSSKTPMAEGALWMIERRSLTLGTVGSLAVVASLVIVNAKSKLTLERVLKCDRSLTLGLGDVLSTSGTLAPMTYLFAPRAIKPTKCFKQVRSASHQTNLFAVAAGQLDVASNNSTSLLLNRRNGRHEADEVRVIWESPTLPEDPIIWRKDLDPAIKEKLRQFLLTYGQGEGPQAAVQRGYMARINIGGFKPADDIGRRGDLLAGSANLRQFGAEFVRPNFTDLPLYTANMWLTIQMALWGTFLALVIAVPLGLAAARNVAPVWIQQPVRRLLDVLRSVPDLVIGAIFVVAVGLGPFAGVMALAINTGGVLGQLFSEAVEGIEAGPREGARGT